MIFVLGFIFTFIFCVAHMGETTINHVLDEAEIKHRHFERKYGDLYYMTHIDDFKVELARSKNGIPFQYTENNKNYKKAEILIFGDSFFELNKFVNIPELLSNHLNENISFIRSYKPLNYLDQAKNVKQIIFELSERFFFDVFNQSLLDKSIKAKKSFKGKVRDVIFPKNIENRYNLILKRSYFSNDLYNFVMTKKYQLFGLINKNVIQSNEDKELLFLSDYLIGNKNNNIFNDNRKVFIEAYSYLKRFNDEVLRKYKTKVLFVIIPNKGTVMYPFDKNKVYNQFLPRLYKEFEKDSLNYVNLYDDFVNSKENLYYKTDTHWNEKAVEITFNKLQKTIAYKWN